MFSLMLPVGSIAEALNGRAKTVVIIRSDNIKDNTFFIMHLLLII